MHLEGFAVVPGPLADLARHVHVGQEVHLDLDGAVAGAGLAATALDVERESSGLIAADLGLGGGGEQGADLVEHTGVGGRVGSRCAPDRRLVHPHQLVQIVQPGDPGVPAGDLPGAVEAVGQHRGQDVVDQRRLARTRDTGHRGQHTQRERHIDPAQVVLAGADDGELTTGVDGTPNRRYLNAFPAGQVGAGDRILVA
ncbi:Uncharacterised protein [Mycobacterium tuberculosis]|nr:Uncharacterised protein [Mycobacterium tuberculosis]CKT90697.1 Uncharacterised protein [Mycobacterium tuberculosis]COW28419.1 Uncharacterised protein [Mycobacterium tuberculosis]